MSAKRILVLVCAALQLAFPAFAVAAYSPAPKDDLGRMELRFFEKTYEKDTQEERLARLEKLVFGEASTGDDAERLQKLKDSVATSDSAITDAANDHSSQNNDAAAESKRRANDADAARKADSQHANAMQQKNDDDTAAAPDAGTEYPAVDALESKVLGHINGERPLRARLAELERQAFGRVSTNPDLSERVVALQRFAKTGQPAARSGGSDVVDERGDTTAGGIVPFDSNAYPNAMNDGIGEDRFDTRSAQEEGNFNSGDIAPRGLNNRVSSIEKQIFGKASKAPLPERLTKLEDAVFGEKEGRHEGSVIERVVRLSNTVGGDDDERQATAQQTPSRRAFSSGTTTSQDLNDLMTNDPMLGSALPPAYTNDNQATAQPKGHPVLHGLGKALSAAGLGAAALLGTVGGGVMMGGPMMGTGGYGTPYGGLGMGMPYGGMYSSPYGGLGMGMPYGGMYSSPYGGGMYSSPYGMGMGMGGLGGMRSFGGFGMGMPFGF